MNNNHYLDLTIYPNAAYRLAEAINDGYYTNVQYFEFHKHLDASNHVYESERLSRFRKSSDKYYGNFICHAYPDEFEAIIEVAVKLGDQWFISFECGANYYGGFGPQGIIELRKSCSKHKIPVILIEEDFNDWLEKNFAKANDSKAIVELNEFERIVKILRFFCTDMQSKPSSFAGLNEETIRDKMITSLNAATEGRASAESKSVKGKTDILVKTEDGSNEYIFELKVWRGPKSLIETILQIKGYLQWDNEFCGILIFCYYKDFSRILRSAKKYISENFRFNEKYNVIENREMRFYMNQKSDKDKEIEVNLIFVNLHEANPSAK